MAGLDIPTGSAQKAEIAAGYVELERLADEIFLILEGARIDIQSVGQCGPGAKLNEMVTAMMKRHPRRGD